MVMYTTNQVMVFLSTLYVGLIIGIIYDFYRVLRRIIKPGKWITGAGDLLFWIATAVLAFAVLFYVNDGEVRLYNFLGFALGWMLYILALSRWVMALLMLLYKVVREIVLWTAKVIAWPIRMLIRILGYPGRVIGKGFNWISLRMKKRKEKKQARQNAKKKIEKKLLPGKKEFLL